MSSKKPVVLVVDDEMMNFELARMVLTADGYDVEYAHNGQEALEQLPQKQFDAILMDVMMPVMDGFEATRRIKADERYSDIPLVIVTAANDKSSLKTGLAAGANEFLGKPYDIEELKLRMRNMLKLKAQSDALKDTNKLLEEKVQERTKQLQEALTQIKNSELDIIQILGKASEFRDNDTGAHILRMSHFAERIARTLGFSKEDSELLLHAAPMHDVGKIGIPDEILLKPAKLSDEEFATMKKHAVIGAEILSFKATPLLIVAKEISLTHHEKWDGTGYPFGLSGEAIPIFGRICAVADVFDALTTRRPYKEPFGMEKATDIIKSGSGSHFDPSVTDAFFSCFDEIIDIKKQVR